MATSSPDKKTATKDSAPKQYMALTPIDCGERYEIGDTLELDDKTAADLLAVKAIAPVKAS